MGLYLKKNSNTYPISFEEAGCKQRGGCRVTGVAIHLEYTVFAHSCRPNAILVHIGNALQIRAIAPIDTDKELITVDYIDPL